MEVIEGWVMDWRRMAEPMKPVAPVIMSFMFVCGLFGLGVWDVVSSLESGFVGVKPEDTVGAFLCTRFPEVCL